MHKGVDFEDLQCHEQIKDRLQSASFYLTEHLHDNNLLRIAQLQAEEKLSQDQMDIYTMQNNIKCFSNTEDSSTQNQIEGQITFLFFESAIQVLIQSSLSKEDQAKVLVSIMKQRSDSLNDLDSLVESRFVKRTIATKEDLEEWQKNRAERCSEDTLKSLTEHESDFREQVTQKYLSGELNLEEDYVKRQWDHPGYLDTEIKQSQILEVKTLLDYRHKRWLPRIIEAHKTHDSVFISAGLAHLIAQDRNPLNIPELKSYAESNQDLPTNILDMLKQEGFTVNRMGPDCSF